MSVYACNIIMCVGVCAYLCVCVVSVFVLVCVSEYVWACVGIYIHVPVNVGELVCIRVCALLASADYAI